MHCGTILIKCFVFNCLGYKWCETKRRRRGGAREHGVHSGQFLHRKQRFSHFGKAQSLQGPLCQPGGCHGETAAVWEDKIRVR